MANTITSLLNIGNEIVSGSILNSHSQRMSQLCTELGLNVQYHLAVDDNIEKIKGALEYLSKHSDIVFVTGGLGPTSDDLTRHALAEWSGLSLEENAESLTRLKKLLSERGLKFYQGHAQQCLFPKTSRIMKNLVGTADGFYFFYHETLFVALPGPTNELTAMWKNDVIPLVHKSFAIAKPQIRHYWVLGLAESELAALTDPILKTTQFDVGYRIAEPFIELRISNQQGYNFEEIEGLLKEALGHFLWPWPRQDLAEVFLQNLSEQGLGLYLEDQASQGELAKRFLQSSACQQTPLVLNLGGNLTKPDCNRFAILSLRKHQLPIAQLPEDSTQQLNQQPSLHFNQSQQAEWDIKVTLKGQATSFSVNPVSRRKKQFPKLNKELIELTLKELVLLTQRRSNP